MSPLATNILGWVLIAAAIAAAVYLGYLAVSHFENKPTAEQLAAIAKAQELNRIELELRSLEAKGKNRTDIENDAYYMLITRRNRMTRAPQVVSRNHAGAVLSAR